MENWNNIGTNVYVPTVVLLYSVWFTAKITAFHLSAFLQNYLILAWYTFRSFKLRTDQSNLKIKLMTNSNYLATITIINKGSLNKKLLLCVFVVLT